MRLSTNSVLNDRLSRAGVDPGFEAGPRRPFLGKLSVQEAVPTLILIIGATLVALPLLWMFSTSLRPSAESYKLPPQWLPTQFHWENYGALFNSSVPFLLLFFNSLKITTAVTIGQLIFCSMAGFAFARLRFPGRQILFVLLLASLMIPNQVTVIPIFLIMKNLGLIDTHLSIILPGLVSAFGVFLMRQFYLTLPQELIDAAKLDGASPWRIYTRIAVPLSAPALAALGVISFNTTWNSYFYPLIFLTSWEKMTLPQGIALLQGYMQSGNPSVVMAGVTMAILPVLSIFLLAQRWIVEAFVHTGLKG
ncbi:MAG TPA: carbohydrate ABC transporter permease [Chthoniobacterales bacterium]|nr:carbohydrate ABC transporter permease [Chthoniobacterales bacterium]